MKTLLCVIAALALLTLPVMAEDVKVSFEGTRLAAGYMDNGSQANATPGTFGAPDVKVKLTSAFDADTVAVLRLNFDDAMPNGADYAYVKLSNVFKKLAKSDMVNPDIYVGAIKVNFGEETWSNNPVEGALVHNSISGLSGEDLGLELRQNALEVGLPLTLGYSLSFMNGEYDGTFTTVGDVNNTKAYALKIMGTMKSMPLYFSLSQYDSGRFTGTSVPALSSDLLAMNPLFGTANTYIKGYELNVRYDLLEGAQKFDPTKAPLFSDAKAVLRLAYGAGSAGGMNLISESTTMMLDGIYNVDKAWFVAFRYSSLEDVNGDQYTRMSFGGGNKLSDKTMLKLTYSTNSEPSASKVDNDQVALLMTLLW